MVKADLVLPDGTKVVIEGLAEEVAGVLAKFSSPGDAGRRSEQRKTPVAVNKGDRTRGGGPISLIRDLANEDFFKTKRTIGDVQTKLEERGHIYAVTSLSPALLRLTQNRTIRRIKEGKGWLYVK